MDELTVKTDLCPSINFASFIESIPDGLILINPEGRIILINKQTEDIFAYKRDEILGELIEILLPHRKGEISYIVCNPELVTYYHQNNIPMLCTNKQGRTLAEGVYIHSVLMQKYQDYAVLMPLMMKIACRFNQNLGNGGLHIMEREDDCQQLYSFFFDLNEYDFLHWVINNGNFLNDLLLNYKHHIQDQILEAKSPESRIVLPSSDGHPILAFENSHQLQMYSYHTNLSLQHHISGLEIHLSSQQIKCLKILWQGKSAKEIGKVLNLSYRTVEHYLERIRKVLGCRTNKEIIAFYGDQLIKKFNNNI